MEQTADFGPVDDAYFPEFGHEALTAQVTLPPAVREVTIQVAPGEVITLPFDADVDFQAAIGHGNLAIKVGEVVVILEGYVAAAGARPPVIESADGHALDIAAILAATDPAIDIATAAGPDSGPAHADNSGAILQLFGGAAGLGGFESVGGQGDSPAPNGFSALESAGVSDLRQSDLRTGVTPLAVAASGGGSAPPAEHGPNTPPVVQDLSLVTDEDSRAEGVLSALDANGDPVSFHLVGPAPDGLTLGADGAWSFNPQQQYDFLKPAQQSAVTFQYAANDGQADSNVATVTIAIEGKNDPAIITGGGHGDYYLDDRSAGIGGSLYVWDADQGQAHALSDSGHSAYGWWTVLSDGRWEYSVDGKLAYPALVGKETVTDEFILTSLDGSASRSVTITIHAHGDPVAPKIQADGGIRGLTEEDTTTVSLSDFTTIIDPDSTSFTYYASGALPAGVSLAPDGTLRIDLAGHYDGLAEGQSQVVDVKYYVGDGFYASNTGTFSIFIDGVNDPASFSGDATGTYLFGSGVGGVAGVLTVTDPDTGEAHTKASAGTATYGSWTVDDSGDWVYTPDANNDAVRTLGHGQTLTDQFTVFSADLSASQSVTVTIEGLDVKPQIATTFRGIELTEDESRTVHLADFTTINDPDSTAFVYGKFAFFPAGVSLDADGTLHIDAAGEYDFLRAGQSTTVIMGYSVTEADHPGQTSNLVPIPIVITGVNDPATLSEPKTADYFLNTGTSAIGGALFITDPDQGEAHTVAGSGHSSYGTWTIFDDGNWWYSVDDKDPDVAQLAASASDGTLTDQFVMTSLDGTASQTITIDIHGHGDAQPHITSTLTTVALTEESTKTIDLSAYATVSDPDSPSLSYVSFSPAISGITLTPDGKLTIDAADYFDSIPGGKTQVIDFSYGVSDGHSGSNREHIAIEIAGSNDPAGISGVTSGSYVVGSGNSPVTHSVVVSDVDTGEAHTAALHGGATYGTWSVDEYGDWFYRVDPTDPAVKTLGADETLTDHFTVTSFDHTASQEITITIHGAGYIEPAAPFAPAAARAASADLIFGGNDDDTLIYRDGAAVQGGGDSVAPHGGLADPAARGDVLAIGHSLDLTALDLSGFGGIETLSLLNRESGAGGAQSLAIDAAAVKTLSDHSIAPDAVFGEHGAIRIDADAVDQLYLSIGKTGGGWTDTGIVLGGQAIYAHEAVAGHADSTDAYIAVDNAAHGNVHLNLDAP